VKLRLIVKVPEHCQTGPDSWQDTTHFVTHVVDCPESLARQMGDEGWLATVVGAELIPDGDEP